MNKEKIWGTFYGRVMKVSELSHQHLSNILYYFELILETDQPFHIRHEINVRFGGIQLPYKPLISFKEEINELVRKGYTTGEINAPIKVRGQWVGEISYQ